MHGKAARRLKVFVTASVVLCAGFLGLPSHASARSEHKRPLHIAAPAPAAPFTGFGPTAPGVSAILIDAQSGAVLSESGADIPRYPASLTKLMVLDLTFQAIRDGRLTLDTRIPVSYHAASVEPVKLGLQPGDSLTVRQAVLAMTTMSANDAATALGEYLGGGSEDRCGEMMTLRAHVLGMAQSQFVNASGLPNPNQVSTARDLAILARDIVVSFPQDQPFFEAQKFDLNGHIIYSNNQMLKIYPGATGMKTGYTILAKHNLITSAERNGRVLIGVVLHEPSWGETYGQMTAMLNDGFGASDGMAYASNPPAASQPAASPPAVSPPVYAPPVVAPAPPGGLSLFPSANAATVHPAQKLAMAPPVRRGVTGSWTAEVGSYKRQITARSRAIAVRDMRGVGIPRVAKIVSHGKILWAAQLAGLTEPAAHATCSALTARGDTCSVIAPAEHFARRESGDSDS
jgi:D-alanyl-D-alanine carboxypeptidase